MIIELMLDTYLLLVAISYLIPIFLLEPY